MLRRAYGLKKDNTIREELHCHCVASSSVIDIVSFNRNVCLFTLRKNNSAVLWHFGLCVTLTKQTNDVCNAFVSSQEILGAEWNNVDRPLSIRWIDYEISKWSTHEDLQRFVYLQSFSQRYQIFGKIQMWKDPKHTINHKIHFSAIFHRSWSSLFHFSLLLSIFYAISKLEVREIALPKSIYFKSANRSLWILKKHAKFPLQRSQNPGVRSLGEVCTLGEI